jgi:beta-N-acetylhexosaminidase
MRHTILNFFFLLLAVALLWYCKPSQTSKPITVVEQKQVEKQQVKPLDGKSYSLDFKIGQMIMIGINDRKLLELNDALGTEISEGKTGGIILFEKNISTTNSKAALQKLISDMQAKAKVPLLMSIDEEGGKVHRLKEKYGFVAMPSAAYLGNVNNLDSTLYYTKNLAALLAELGFNVNFAPDVDLALNENNPVIAKVGRSYSADPKVVSSHALTSIQGHHAFGVKTAIKHFPGHGSSSTDSHLGITDVTKQWQYQELLPYRDIIQSGTCDAIMTAHIINCHLDTTCLPATLSKVIVTDILRGVLGFEGLVFSDDMQMHAISKNYGLENAVKLSILAGVDVLVFGNNVTQTYRTNATEVHAIIKKLLLSGEISEARINESFMRIMAFKSKEVNR